MSSASRKPAAAVPRIALTGGIASGKSTVAKLFTTLGAQLIDTDRIAHEIVVPPSAVLERIVARFGPGVLLPGGSLNRARLRQIVFADPQARQDLEAIMHPAIRAEVERLAGKPRGPYQLVAVPLLVETGTQRQYDRVLLVETSPATRKRRLMLRDGIDAAAADRMLAAQATDAARRAAAHDIIDNEGDPGRLAAQVERLHRSYLALRSPPHDS
ncbi:MAG TPA: dephospho-CoA kinase [Steroidobacteraceae bacterium]|nr:dephospho-CoA kinase [Steroidobacteraceae bacterium]